MSTRTRERVAELTKDVLTEINAAGWLVVEVDLISVGEVDMTRGGRVTLGEMQEWTVKLRKDADNSGTFSFLRNSHGEEGLKDAIRGSLRETLKI